MTGLEPDPDAAEQARGRGVPVEEIDLLGHHGGPYDAVLCVRSLHHVASLDDAVSHALGMLNESGALVLDEFCRERADERAAAFFYDLRGLLYASGLASPHEDDENDPARDPLERWHRELAHTDDHPLHEGAQVRAAVAAHAETTYEARVPYLWRHILGTSTQEEDTWAGPVAAYLRAVERRRITEGSLPAIGLRLVARRSP